MINGWIGPEHPHYAETMALLSATVDIIDEGDVVAPSLGAADRAAIMVAAVANWAARHDHDHREAVAATFERWAGRLRSGTFPF